MVQPKCTICGLALESGAEEVTAEDLNFTMSGVLNKDFGLPVGEEAKKKQERAEHLKSVGAKEQVKYHAHDPRNIHCDIEFYAHKVCFEKVKAIYPDFDKPTEADWGDYKLPVINKQAVGLKRVSDFIKLKIL